jgi:hypothetical protein
MCGNVAGNPYRQPVMKSKWAKMCAQRIQTETLTEPQLRTMRRILANCYNAGKYSMPESKHLTRSEADTLLQMIQQTKPRVSDEQSRKGADWLYNAVYTPRGALRCTDFAREFTAADRDVILQLRERPHFTLNELEDIGRDGWTVFAPVYNAIGLDSFFRYAAVAWQTGRPFVTRHA